MKTEVWPVIHVTSLNNTIEELSIIKKAGCNGVGAGGHLRGATITQTIVERPGG